MAFANGQQSTSVLSQETSWNVYAAQKYLYKSSTFRESAGIYTCISLYSDKYVTETDIVGDKEGGMRVKRRAVNTLDGGSARYGYDSICLADSI